MDKSQAVAVLKETATLLELHGADTFRVQHYRQAALHLERLEWTASDWTPAALRQATGVGQGMAAHLHTLLTTGRLPLHETLLKETPTGVRAMLQVQGLGPKKVHKLWKSLGIQDSESLSKACISNQVAALPGFGAKTQAMIQASLAFVQAQQGQWHYATLLPYATQLEQALQQAFPSYQVSLSGAMRRKVETAMGLQYVVGTTDPLPVQHWLNQCTWLQQNPQQSDPWTWQGQLTALEAPVEVQCCIPAAFFQHLIRHTGSPQHLAISTADGKTLGELLDTSLPSSEADFYAAAGLGFIPPELREGQLEQNREAASSALLTMNDLQGVLHVHTNYSDGKDSLAAMAHHCKELGYQYIGITDHSQAAAYAGGLKPADIQRQHAAIDALNQQLAPFKIFKGIEADILGDGTLDYPAAVLAQFDFVIASIHTGLQMDRQQATQRLLRAIENPFTTMLGHPTGRLLLQRPGYPIDHPAIIAACAAHGVAIEINAHPWRLDLDWRWIPLALQHRVVLSINPDAHAKEKLQDLYYGVCIARKGGLTSSHTLNAWSSAAVAAFFAKKRAKQP